MIKFVPYHVNHNTGSLKSFIENKNAFIEKAICNALNNKEIDFKCEKIECAEIDSEIAIYLDDYTAPKHEYKIIKYCCEEFNERLKVFLSPVENPD